MMSEGTSIPKPERSVMARAVSSMGSFSGSRTRLNADIVWSDSPFTELS